MSISKLFLAGIVPGLMLGAALWLTWWWLVRSEKIVPPPRKPLREVLAAFRDATWALVLPVIILVGLKFGVFTPTEARGGRGLRAVRLHRDLPRAEAARSCTACSSAAAQTSAVVMFLVAAAMVSAWLITVANLPAQVVALLQPLLGQPDAADDRDHGAGDDRRHGAWT